MRIRYKVLRKDRYSSVAPKEYSILYSEKAVVKAPPNTIGLMCFTHLKYATKFAHDQKQFHCRGPFIIVRVQPIGIGVVPKNVCNFLNNIDFHYFYHDSNLINHNAPEGTICYKSVLVLEEVKG